MHNPAVPGFFPDPSVCRVGDDYWMVNSTFEYVPGIPIHHSTDGEHWTHVGHVATRPAQLRLENVTTGMGVWAPTIRHRDGLYYVIVNNVHATGPVIYTATDPRGEWSDPLPLEGVDGIDHDLVWGDDGAAYVTFSGLILQGPNTGAHLGIQQVRMDLETRKALEEPRSLWSGTGGKFPEAPHVYKIGDWWYLMIAEGGTERGHSISIARATSPEGPFEGAPRNPIYTHRGTNHLVQNAGHGDLYETDEGWCLTLLGTRPTGATQSFAQLGRETWQTRLTWEDGWPVVETMELTENIPPLRVDTDLTQPLGLEWITIRDSQQPWLTQDERGLALEADPDASGPVMDGSHPRFVGRRQQHLAARFAVTIDPAEGEGGLSLRYDEQTHYDVEIAGGVARARVRIAQIEHCWEVPAPEGPVRLWIESVPAEGKGFTPKHHTCDTISIGIGTGAETVTLAEMDGRYLTSDVCASFTGRVGGPYAVSGTPRFTDFTYGGADAWSALAPALDDAVTRIQD